MVERGLAGEGATAYATGGIRHQFSSRVNIELVQRSQSFWLDFEARTGAPLDFRQHGYLFLISDPGSLEVFERNATLQRSLGDEAVEAYTRRYGGYMARALAEEPTAKQAIARLLHEAADQHTRRGRPRGCMLLCADDNTTNTEVAHQLRRLRKTDIAMFEQRIRADIEAGILPPDPGAAALARYTSAVLRGISQSARDGATRHELEQVAELAIQGWS